MYPISQLFSDYLRGYSREYAVKVEVGETTYDSSAVVSFVIESSLTSSDEFEVGTAILSKLTITLRTTDVIPANARIVPYLAIKPRPGTTGAAVTWGEASMAWGDANFPWGGGQTEWLPMGEFYVDAREQVNSTWVFTCYDKLVFANVPYISSLTYPASMQTVWDEICGRLGYVYDSSVVIDPSYQIQVGPAGYSMRQVLGYIAGANAASVFVGKDGTVKFKRYDAGAGRDIELTDADYIRAKQTNPIRTYTRVVVTYNTEDGLSYEAGSGDDAHTLAIENPFVTPDMMAGLYTAFNGFSYTPIDMDSKGFPQIEPGDVIRFGRKVGTPAWGAADTAWGSTAYSWDGYTSGGMTLALHTTFSFRGGLKMAVQAPSKSDQQSEFKVEGTLTQQINKLNQSTIKEGKPYYGVSMSRTEGFVIEREDHLSKLTLNSDMMDWQVNGESTLYYDALANKLKFTGSLEGATGTFSGALSAATGTFAGSLSAAGGTFAGSITIGTANEVVKADNQGLYVGHSSFGSAPFSVDMQGHMSAFNAEFQGDITASSITGGDITGTTLTGGTITGSLIRTAATGSRIEFRNDIALLRAYSTDSRYISINPLWGSGPAIQFDYDGSNTFNLLMNGPHVLLGATNQLLLQAPGGIYISGGWSNLFTAGGSSLQAALNGLALNMTYDSTTKNLKLWSADGSLLSQVNISGS